MGGTKSGLIGDDRCVICGRKAKYGFETGKTGDCPSNYKTHYLSNSVVCAKHFRMTMREQRKENK